MIFGHGLWEGVKNHDSFLMALWEFGIGTDGLQHLHGVIMV